MQMQVSVAALMLHFSTYTYYPRLHKRVTDKGADETICSKAVNQCDELKHSES